MNLPSLEIPAPSSARFSEDAVKSGAVAEDRGMRVVHVLRKCNPAEWGGTETAVQRLVAGLRGHGVESTVYCPRLENNFAANPLTATGCTVKRFRAFLPTVGISRRLRQQMIAVGGNLMSFDLPVALWREPNLSVIHAHALGRIGGIASLVARRRGIPFVVTIHGGFLDLPEAVRESFKKSSRCGWEWGRLFGFLLRSRRLLHQADAVLTCNPKEAALLRGQFPDRRIVVQPHGISVDLYRQDCRWPAHEAFPQIRGRPVLLCAGRIDPVKNQRWLVEEAPAIVQRHPRALLVLAGPCTDEGYGEGLQARIRELHLENHVLLTGGLPPGDERLIGLFQSAQVVLLPSVSETFGLVILEAWASGTTVIASRTSGAAALIREGGNGWLFDHGDANAFHQAVDVVLLKPEVAAKCAVEGDKIVNAGYDNTVLTGRMKNLYTQLVEEKYALRHSARR
jgi:glycosyltransferase involved in cell wall biosynthesis